MPRATVESRGPSKRARVRRKSTEFNLLRLVEALRPPRSSSGAESWDYEAIRVARDLQRVGKLQRPSQLSSAQKTDDAIFTALRNRLASTRGLPVELVPPNGGARAARVLAEGLPLFGADGIAVRPDTVGDMHEQYVEHGVGFGYCVHTPRPDGSRIDLEVCPWPAEHTDWNPTTCQFEALLEDGRREPIIHGDGRWIVVRSHRIAPWRWGAVNTTSGIWYDRAHGVRDRGRASTSHGNAKVIGELPADVPIDSQDGVDFLLLLKTMHEALPYGIRPAGSKTEMLVNTSTAYQVFNEIINGRLADAARVYNGHDGTVRSQGGNYIKDGYLFGVSVDIIEADLEALERAIFEGAIQPWAAINFGDSSLAFKRRWKVPDVDQDTRDAALQARTKAFNEALTDFRGNGFVVDQPFVDQLAATYRVVAPKLADAAPSGGELFQYDLELGIVTINEARHRRGLPPIPGGDVTVPAARARAEAAATAASPGAPGGGTPGGPGHPPSGGAPPPAATASSRSLRAVP